MVKKTLKVNGMTCAMCAKTIENTFEQMPDIKAEALVSANKVIMTYDETKYSLEKIAKTIKSLGYEPVLKENLNDNKKIRGSMKIELMISIALSIPLLWAMFSRIQVTSFIKAPALFTNGIF
ncbi:MAG TPA: cation transporter, partial [Bacillota bacterium]|nr:cation transporter [Bacillota bacterium]